MCRNSKEKSGSLRQASNPALCHASLLSGKTDAKSYWPSVFLHLCTELIMSEEAEGVYAGDAFGAFHPVPAFATIG